MKLMRKIFLCLLLMIVFTWGYAQDEDANSTQAEGDPSVKSQENTKKVEPTPERKSDDVFVPEEQISEDEPIAFPIDI